VDDDEVALLLDVLDVWSTYHGMALISPCVDPFSDSICTLDLYTVAEMRA
jgi:hypothetical protein